METNSSINEKQGSFYDELHKKGGVKTGNSLMRFWYRFRLKVKAVETGSSASSKEKIKNIHKKWFLENSHKNVLNLGCGAGTPFGLWAAGECPDYIAIDLSQVAINKLNERLVEANLFSQRVYAEKCDFLNNQYKDESFDMVYAAGVLHHFADLEALCKELHRVLKPGGVVISIDPMQTNQVTQLWRRFYRIFQTNRDWEYPFNVQAFKTIEKFFNYDEISGFWGMSLCGIFLSMIPGLKAVGDKLYQLGMEYDQRHAVKQGAALWRCHKVALLLRKPDSDK